MSEDYAVRPMYRARAAHEQKLVEADATKPLRDFEGCQFVSYVTGMKFDKHGGIELTITVQREFVDEALKMKDSFSLPMSMDVQLWHPFVDAIASEYFPDE